MWCSGMREANKRIPCKAKIIKAMFQTGRWYQMGTGKEEKKNQLNVRKVKHQGRR